MLEKMEVASTRNTVSVRRKRSTAEKRQIVEETYQQRSVRSVARAHDIPANQVFHWRKLYREGRLGNSEQVTNAGLIAVRVFDEQQKLGVNPTADQLAVRPSLGVIQLESEKGRLCVQGAADPATLRVVLERLLG